LRNKFAVPAVAFSTIPGFHEQSSHRLNLYYLAFAFELNQLQHPHSSICIGGQGESRAVTFFDGDLSEKGKKLHRFLRRRQGFHGPLSPIPEYPQQ
jgi:hypothetical protein